MKLFYATGACSLAPHILLHDTKLPFTLVRVDTRTHALETGEDYYQINSKGAVPVLELDDGERLTEGPVVAQYICDKARRTDLMPAAGAWPRYRVMEWQNYVTSELHKSFSPLFNPATEETAKAAWRAALRKRYTWVAERLADRAYLTGDTFTAADAYLFTVTRWAALVGIELGDLHALQSFMQRVERREAVQEALIAEGLARKAA